MVEPQVSVVLPLYGDHRAGQALPAVCRAWLRQDVPCEVVVAVTDGTTVPALGDATDATADARIRVVTAAADLASPGPLRNLAAAASRASLLYLGDADIAPLGRDFLRRALALSAGGVVVQPWMYRLVNPADAPDGPLIQPPGRARVCHVSVDGEGRLTPLDGERFAWLGPDLMVAEAPDGTGWAHEENGTAWRPFPFHWGGILAAHATFDAVGGYCARYVGWGCEDDDLIAKLAGRAQLVRAWRVARGLACLHFEHPRTHTSATIQVNRAVLAERLAAGVDAMIDEDR